MSTYAELFAALRGYAGEVFPIENAQHANTLHTNELPESVEAMRKCCGRIFVNHTLHGFVSVIYFVFNICSVSLTPANQTFSFDCVPSVIDVCFYGISQQHTDQDSCFVTHKHQHKRVYINKQCVMLYLSMCYGRMK
jgi:hypothetical protein